MQPTATQLLWERRKRAVALVEAGKAIDAVAEQVGVTSRSLYSWLAMHRDGEDLAVKSPLGRPRKVSKEQAFAVFAWLDERGKLTGRNAVDRIECKHGVGYTRHGVYVLIREWRAERGQTGR